MTQGKAIIFHLEYHPCRIQQSQVRQVYSDTLVPVLPNPNLLLAVSGTLNLRDGFGRNTRKRAGYSTFFVSNSIFGGFLKIENLGSFRHSLGLNLTYLIIVDFITLWTSPQNSTNSTKSINSTNSTFISQNPHLFHKIHTESYEPHKFKLPRPDCWRRVWRDAMNRTLA
jgi:hypothetical protein